MVQTSGADVVGPAISADQPNTLAHQRVGHSEKRPGFRGVHGCEFALEFGDALPLRLDAGLLGLIGFQKPGDKRLAQLAGELREELFRVQSMLVDCQPHTQAKFSIVFKERVRPGWPAALPIYGIWRGWQ